MYVNQKTKGVKIMKEKIYVRTDGFIYGFSNNKKGYEKIDYAIWNCTFEEAVKKFVEHYSSNNERQFEFVR